MCVGGVGGGVLHIGKKWVDLSSEFPTYPSKDDNSIKLQVSQHP